MSLKLLIDTETNKVLFAEAGKDFVDFLFQLMSLPLSTVTKLLVDDKGIGMPGCLGALYKSIQSFNTDYFEVITNNNKDSVLKAKAFVTVPLLSLNDAPASVTYYKCPHHNSYFSHSKGSACHCGVSLTHEITFDHGFPSRKVLNSKDASYVKGLVPYIVLDNLEVKPMSISLVMSIVKNYDSLKEKEVEVGPQEGLALLKASLEKQAALTSVFLRNKI